MEWLYAVGIFIALWIFQVILESRILTWCLIALGVLTVFVYAYYPQIIPTVINVAEGTAGLTALLFILASPFVLVGGIVWLVLKALASMTAAEVVRRTKEGER
ncbi:MAG: hypothetical protein ACYDBH_23110 [Acidobacteriaceae bacterium]